MHAPPNLCYTISLDLPGQHWHRNMARLLVTSLLKTGWNGPIVVFRNHARAVLPEGHVDVHEVQFDATPEAVWHRTVSWKYRVRDQLDLAGISKVLFLDCDCLALRNINHLMAGRWDIYTAAEPGRIVEAPFNGYLTDEEMTSLKGTPGLNSGCIGVRAEHYLSVMDEWERIASMEPTRPSKCRNQHSWNRLIRDTALRHRTFHPGEIQFPFLHRAVYSDYRQAALVHAADRGPAEKLALLYGLWMETFAGEHLDEFTTPNAARE